MRARARSWRGRRLVLAFAAAILAVGAASAHARVLMTQQQALDLAFPGCSVARQTVYLTPAQVGRAGELAAEPLRSALVTAYRATCGGAAGGTAYFDVHRVRTLQETLMVVVDPQARIRRLEVLSFDEPPDYIPRRPWYEQFERRGLDAELQLKRAIRPVTGATLTAQATTAAARRVLAIHRAIAEVPAAAVKARPGSASSAGAAAATPSPPLATPSPRSAPRQERP
jgi:hypothetical protein